MFDKRTVWAMTAIVTVASGVTRHASAQTVLGFSMNDAAKERALDSNYVAAVNSRQISDYHLHLTAEPHRATSPRNNDLADWVADQWRTQGWEKVEFSRYRAYFSEPKSISLEMTAPTYYRAGLREDAYSEDASTQRSDLPGAYNADSASGDLTADVVYARGGNPQDFDYLRRQGISVTGKIVLVRYSHPYSFRGFKVMNAQEEGAAAVLIYSDPAEDGAARGHTFPAGPWGPDSHLQRGFTAFGSIVPGDPTTPGWPSVKGARHLNPKQAATLPKIMVLAISARDARPLLESMSGPAAPQDWQGKLPITYRLSGGVRAHLRVQMQTSLRTYTNVQARIQGSQHPEQLVVLGNHRDAWVFGGADPSSGTAAFLELTRGLGELKKIGWRPKRTIVVCNWDGEEKGLVGSTEWVEQHAEELKENFVAYLNVDTAIFGVRDEKTGQPGPHLYAMSVPSLAGMIVQASKDVPAPTGGTLYDAWRHTKQLELGTSAIVSDADLVDTGLDASSDLTAFLVHLSRPVIALSYDGQYGVYHSIYDDRYYMDHYGDPGFKYSAAVAELWGLLGMRLADADVLPLNFAPYADVIEGAVRKLEVSEAVRSHLSFAPLHAAVAAFKLAAQHTDEVSSQMLASSTVDIARLDALNSRLMAVESNWYSEPGVPGRPWMKHLIYGMQLTFLPLMMPGLTEAVAREDWPAAQIQISLIESALAANAQLLRETGI